MHLTMMEMVYQDIQVTNNWNVKLKAQYHLCYQKQKQAKKKYLGINLTK